MGPSNPAFVLAMSGSAAGAKAKAAAVSGTSTSSSHPARDQLERLDSVFGPEYFECGRLVITVARDIQGLMTVAHKLQAKVNEHFGAVVEVFMEHVKHESWLKLHEATASMGLHKGDEVPDVQITHIPEGIRVHPYKREHLPTLEVLLLWEDRTTGATKGHCLHSVSHPDLPSLSEIEQIFSQIQPYFAKRWLHIALAFAPPVKGEFQDLDADASENPAFDAHIGGGVDVTLLACHPYGFARDQQGGADAVAHVTQCQPMVFKAVSDDGGVAKMCFLPADINKVQVAETARFYGTEVVMKKDNLNSHDQGPTVLKIELTPKAFAAITVHVFAMPRVLPASEETDGIIDWAAEERDSLPSEAVTVLVTSLKDSGKLADTSTSLLPSDGDAFVAPDGGLSEGCVVFTATCEGYAPEERTVMLLVGTNDFYVPLKKIR